MNGKADMEPGRCKRTDGKKWRCSRDVAPNQKYCERHMNRGRPRSRKHVEQQQFQHLKESSNNHHNTSNNNNDNKRIRHGRDHHDYNSSGTSATALPASNDTSTTVVTQTHLLGVGGSSNSMPNYHNYPCVNTASPFESRLVFFVF